MKNRNGNIPFGRGGAFDKNVGVDPTTAVLGRGIVAELGCSELMTERGAAVGLVASSVKLGKGAVVPPGAAVVPPGGEPGGAEAGEPAGGAAAEPAGGAAAELEDETAAAAGGA